MRRPYGAPLSAALTMLTVLCWTVLCWQPGSGWLAWGPAPAAAQTADETADRIVDQDATAPDESANEQVVDLHERVSLTVSEVAGWLDEYLGDERYEAEANRTRLKLKLAAFLEEGESVDFTPVFILRLVLPRTSRRLHVIASRGRSADTLDYDEEPSDSALDRFQVADDDNMFLALRYFFWEQEQRNFSVEGGVGYLHNDETVGFTSLRYRQLYDFDPWAPALHSEAGGVHRAGLGHLGHPGPGPQGLGGQALPPDQPAGLSQRRGGPVL